MILAVTCLRAMYENALKIALNHKCCFHVFCFHAIKEKEKAGDHVGELFAYACAYVTSVNILGTLIDYNRGI